MERRKGTVIRTEEARLKSASIEGTLYDTTGVVRLPPCVVLTVQPPHGEE